MTATKRATIPGQPGTVRAGKEIKASQANGDQRAENFKKRVADRRVNLVQRIKAGIEPVDYLPASEGMLIRGKRHLIPGPKKSGKSIATLVHCVAMVLAGARVVIFDRENGANEYARRLNDIFVATNLSEPQQKRLERHLDYYAFPRFKKDDRSLLARFVLSLKADLVVFDATRMFLTDLGLQENSADDYSEFMAALVDPLAEVNVSTLILDNTGHENQGRARATVAKGDLNEVLFTFEKVEQFNLDHQGSVRLKIADSRFGNEGEWEMVIGGGAYEPWKRVGDEKPVPPEFVAAAQKVLDAAGNEGLSQTKTLVAIRNAGVGFRSAQGRKWMYRIRANPAIPIVGTSGDGPKNQITYYSTAA